MKVATQHVTCINLCSALTKRIVLWPCCELGSTDKTHVDAEVGVFPRN